MIDTITLRIHNLEKYAATLNTLRQIDGKSTKSVITGFDEETGEVFEKQIQNKKLSAVLFHDNNRMVFHNVSGTIGSPSSHYDIHYRIREEAQTPYIEFSFSIPKEIYGTNVFQFIDYYDTGMQATWKKLISYIDNFRKTKFINLIDREDIEINRLDICFNQFFQNKQEALSYLDLQKHLGVKMANNDSQPVAYKTSFWMKKKRYVLKVYHKGTEFEANDRKELLKNPAKYDIEELQYQADRILRYEISFNNKYFNYHFGQTYENINSKFKNNAYYKLFNILKIDGKKKLVKKFMLESVFDYYDIIKKEKPKEYIKEFQNNRNVTFTYLLFSHLWKIYWQFVKKFQLNTVGELDYVRKLIAEYNEAEKVRVELTTKKAKLIQPEKLIYWVIQSQTFPLKHFYQNGVLGKTRYYAILKLFKKLGLSDYNPTLHSAKPSLEHTEYKAIFGRFH